jgi:hypothetical protein
MSKTLQGTSIITTPAIAEIINNEGNLLLRVDERGQRIGISVTIGKTVGQDHGIAGNKSAELINDDYTAVQTELNAFLNAVWARLKTMGVVDFP